MKVQHEFLEDATRYDFDRALCSFAQGWAQFDTTQDASYYGCWINPTQRKFVQYAEGDLDTYTFENDAEMHLFVEGQKQGGRFKAIDPGLGTVLASECIAHGLGPYMHPSVVT